jgi:hypothetical protein
MYLAAGQRRTKCRWKKSKGFFWKKTLAPCQTCEEPAAAAGVELSCAVTEPKNRRICFGSCGAGQNFPGGKTDKQETVFFIQMP